MECKICWITVNNRIQGSEIGRTVDKTASNTIFLGQILCLVAELFWMQKIALTESTFGNVKMIYKLSSVTHTCLKIWRILIQYFATVSIIYFTTRYRWFVYELDFDRWPPYLYWPGAPENFRILWRTNVLNSMACFMWT